MADSNYPLPSSQEATACQRGNGEPLTDAQRDFAKLLGHLLAQLWNENEEQRGERGGVSSKARN